MKRFYKFTASEFTERIQKDITILMRSHFIGCEFKEYGRLDIFQSMEKEVKNSTMTACYAFDNREDFFNWLHEGVFPEGEELNSGGDGQNLELLVEDMIRPAAKHHYFKNGTKKARH